MPQFSYRAIGRDGKPTVGTVDAERLELASRQLRGQGLTLLKLEAGGAAAPGARGHARLFNRGGGPGRREVLAVTSELAVLLRAGLPLDKALRVLIEMAAEPQMRSLLDALLAAVKGGQSLSQALEPHEEVFGNFYISMVRAGEASGKLSEVLDRLVEYLENARANRDTVVSALIYPAILAVVSVLSVSLLLGMVVPQFQTLFDDMGEALPGITRLVIACADFIRAWGWLLVLGAIVAVWVLRRWAGTEEGRTSLHGRLLRLPLAGGIIFQFEVSKFARTVGTLVNNGVALLRSISIAIETVDNRVIRESLQVLPPAVKAGRRISAALEETGMFTPMVIQMIRVGEESGRLDAMMLELARVFDNQVQSGVKRGLTLLEPALILSMGVIIAIIIIAILMGIMSVNTLAV